MFLIYTFFPLGQAALFFIEEPPLHISTAVSQHTIITLKKDDPEHKFSRCALGVRNNKTSLLQKKDSTKEAILEGAYSLSVDENGGEVSHQVLGKGDIIKGSRADEVTKVFVDKESFFNPKENAFHLQITIMRRQSEFVAYRKSDSEVHAQIVWACWLKNESLVRDEDWGTFIADISHVAATPKPMRPADRQQNECWTDGEFIDYGDAKIKRPATGELQHEKIEDGPQQCQSWCRYYHEFGSFTTADGDKGECAAWNFDKLRNDCTIITKEMEKMQIVQKRRSHVRDTSIFVSGPKDCHVDARAPRSKDGECWVDHREIIDGNLIQTTTFGFKEDINKCQQLCQETAACENWSFDKRYFECFLIEYEKEGEFKLKEGTGRNKHQLDLDHFVSGPKYCDLECTTICETAETWKNLMAFPRDCNHYCECGKLVNGKIAGTIRKTAPKTVWNPRVNGQVDARSYDCKTGGPKPNFLGNQVKGVKCGGNGHKAPTCGLCTNQWYTLDEVNRKKYNIQTYCNGECIWSPTKGICTDSKDVETVSCGGHHAKNCSECVKGDGGKIHKQWCNGMCQWSDTGSTTPSNCKLVV